MHQQRAVDNSDQPAGRPTERITTILPMWLRRQIERDAQRQMISLSAVIRQKLAESYPDPRCGEEP